MTAAPLDLDALEALDAKIKPSMSVEDRYDAVQAYSTALRNAAPALFAAARKGLQSEAEWLEASTLVNAGLNAQLESTEADFFRTCAERDKLREALEAVDKDMTDAVRMMDSRLMKQAHAKVRAALGKPSVTEPQAGLHPPTP